MAPGSFHLSIYEHQIIVREAIRKRIYIYIYVYHPFGTFLSESLFSVFPYYLKETQHARKFQA